MLKQKIKEYKKVIEMNWNIRKSYYSDCCKFLKWQYNNPSLKTKDAYEAKILRQAHVLEKGMSWIALFIALAPMLGFLGTVIGMIDAFDKIQAAGDIQPSLVAGGIKVALITTVAGLIVAMILQVFYNYCVAKVESIVNDMEDASVTLLDILVKYNQKH